MKRFFQIVLFSFILLGCSSVKNTAVDMGAGIISDASYEMETETNWENFRQAVPANLKMIEGLLYVNKKNDHLLSTLTKGYGAYAFVVYDSLYLEDQLKGNEMTSNREQALRYYNRSLEYGIRYLKQNGVNYDQLMQSIRQKGGVAKILDQKLGSDLADYESVFFLGQSLMGTINHNKAKIGLIAQLPLAKEMVDWACAKSPEIAGGTCKLVEAIYLASRPRSFGGDSEKAKEIFLQYIKDHPLHWFARASYMQYYLVPMLDEEGFNEQKMALDKFRNEYLALLSEVPSDKMGHPAFEQKNLHIYQALAIKRFEILKKYQADIF